MQVDPWYSSALVRASEAEYVALPLPREEQLATLSRLTDNTLSCTDYSEGITHAEVSLTEAYAVCRRIIRYHSKSFFFSTRLLPAEKRRSVYALYAFCRASDDIVDMPEGDPALALVKWVYQAQAPCPPQNNPILIAWRDTQQRYNLEPALVSELLAGIAMDLTIQSYATFAELWLYCYRVASVVGLLSMGIVGAKPGATPYAIKLGVALQLTNILRDVGEDARRGRVYLPQEDLARFGLQVSDILAGTHDERFRALMRFEIERAQRLYVESWPGIALLSADSRLSIAAAACLYRSILDKIIANEYDVYNKRACLTLREKLVQLPVIWRAVQRFDKL